MAYELAADTLRARHRDMPPSVAVTIQLDFT